MFSSVQVSLVCLSNLISFRIFHMSCRPVLMVSLMFFAALVAMSYARAALLLGCCRCIMSVSIGLQYVVNQPSHILVAPGSVSLIMYRISLSSLTSLQSYTSCSCVADCPATPLSDLCVHICWISSSSLSLTSGMFIPGDCRLVIHVVCDLRVPVLPDDLSGSDHRHRFHAS